MSAVNDANRFVNPATYDIGWDLDGVVYDFRQAISDYLISQGKHHCTVANAEPHWDFYKGWDIPTWEKFEEYYAEGVDAGVVLRVGTPLPGAVQAAQRLQAAGNRIHIVTDRRVGKTPQQHTKDWLAEIAFPYDTLKFEADKTTADTHFFIDDRDKNYLARIAKGQSCHLLDMTWNRNCITQEPHHRVPTVADWVDGILNGSITPGNTAKDLAA